MKSQPEVQPKLPPISPLLLQHIKARCGGDPRLLGRKYGRFPDPPKRKESAPDGWVCRVELANEIAREIGANFSAVQSRISRSGMDSDRPETEVIVAQHGKHSFRAIWYSPAFAAKVRALFHTPKDSPARAKAKKAAAARWAKARS